MRSRHVDTYNHDEDAPTYDRDVQRSDDPIREGYEAVLDWVAEQSHIADQSDAIELGSGTGNLTQRLPGCRSLVCVDVSEEMTAICRSKLGDPSHISYVKADILEYACGELPEFDALVSTYTVHHLTDDEKLLLLDKLADRTRPGGRLVFGDLMVESVDAERELIQQYRSRGDNSTADDIEEEFFWRVDDCVAHLTDLGLSARAERFSELSWGILGVRE